MRVIHERIQAHYEEASPVRHAAGSGPQPDEGGTPDGARFLDDSWQQHATETPGRFDAPTKPVPADWHERQRSGVPHPTPDTPSAPTAHHDSPPPRRGRGAIVAWSLAGLLVLGAAGAGAAVLMGGDDKKDNATSASPGATSTPTTNLSAQPQPPATTSASTGAPSSGAPSTKKSSSSSASASASTSTSAGPPRNDVDAPKDPSALKPAAYAAWKQIKTAMAAQGITLNLNSGKRGWAHQQELWENEIAKTGSEQAAMHLVLPPQKSMHVQGYAVDIYPEAAQVWLQSKGSKYGWCRLYDNEAWHFEYNADYKSGCPARKAGPWE
jgi:LAS superfamily LD-carboxypeptidase LdcB